MSDLIFVPELGLISGKSQNIKVRLWYPQPSTYRFRLRTSSKSRKSQRPSPFSHTQHLLPIRSSTKNQKKPYLPSPTTALEAKMNPRPTTQALKTKKTKQKEDPNDSETFYTTALEVNLQARPLTMAGSRRKHSIQENEPFVNLPTLQQRPTRPEEL